MGEVSPLNEMYRNYRDKGFEFFTIYVREPHPGENYGPHRDFAQKLEFARQCRDQDGIENPLLVDDLEGTVHRLYGVLPNMVYIVSKEGRIVYKAMWTDHDEIRVVLDNLVMADELRAEGGAPETLPHREDQLHPRPVRRRRPREGLRPGRPEGLGGLPQHLRRLGNPVS